MSCPDSTEPSLDDQEKIWSFYQNRAPEAFAAAAPRLEFLVRQIARRSGAVRPSVLNIGIGDGHFERTALARGWHVHALDPDRETAERLCVVGVDAHAGSIEAIPWEDASMDFVVASEVLEHLSDSQRRRGLQEIARILKPRGWLMGTVPYAEDLAAGRVVCPHCGAVFHRWGHQRAFDEQSLAEQLTPWFVVETIRRTAFVSFRDRNLGGKLKSVVRWVLARSGQMIAVPSLYFAARNR